MGRKIRTRDCTKKSRTSTNTDRKIGQTMQYLKRILHKTRKVLHFEFCHDIEKRGKIQNIKTYIMKAFCFVEVGAVA